MKAKLNQTQRRQLKAAASICGGIAFVDQAAKQVAELLEEWAEAEEIESAKPA